MSLSTGSDSTVPTTRVAIIGYGLAGAVFRQAEPRQAARLLRTLEDGIGDLAAVVVVLVDRAGEIGFALLE